MRETGNIFSWLSRASEYSVFQDAQKHVEETYNTVVHFSDAVKAFIDKDLKAKTTAIEKVRESEHRADILRLKMVDGVSQGLIQRPDREDLLQFVETLDKIADWTSSAARLLGFIEHEFPQSVLKNMSAASDLIVSSISKLKEAIDALAKNDFKETIARYEDVDHLEHKADDQKKLFIEAIIHANLEAVDIVLSYQLAEYMEGITDKIEDTAHLVRRIAIRAS
jgi:predicted phosphate transport protein (TIGR00153 family)